MDNQYSELVPLHDALKEIVKDFSLICESVGVTFYLIYGTLLGAARHSDIIPWDDDIDLGMTRDDYEKLVLFFLNNKSKTYSLFCAESSNSHTQIFAKFVRLDGKYDAPSKYYTHPNGLSIDIFPLDEAKPQKNLIQWIRGMWIVHLRRIVNSREKLKNPQFCESKGKRIVRSLIVLPFRCINNHKLLIMTNNLCKKNNGKGLPNIINYSTTDRLFKENDPREYWFPSKKLFLGDMEYPVPGNYSGILSHIYGDDWRAIPPENKREIHMHISDIDKEG